uniref:Uncharacterized protein n=1 Tax=Nelumbo nucifera TaxID=4432 RepID=A0A822XYU9_NELNU|nr:TPA_asm: hypothetical protein HUJ06_025418 [Nelumbo nucifera]
MKNQDNNEITSSKIQKKIEIQSK